MLLLDNGVIQLFVAFEDNAHQVVYLICCRVLDVCLLSIERNGWNTSTNHPSMAILDTPTPRLRLTHLVTCEGHRQAFKGALIHSDHWTRVSLLFCRICLQICLSYPLVLIASSTNAESTISPILLQISCRLEVCPFSKQQYISTSLTL